MSDPSQEETKFWLHERTLSTRYLAENDVLPPAETEKSDRPDHDNKDVRLVDTSALRNEMLGGTWVVECTPMEADEYWYCLQSLVEENKVYFAKVLTAGGRADRGRSTHLIEIQTPNYFDKRDVFRVRELLRDHCGIDEELRYYPDFYRSDQIPSQYDLPNDFRYTG